MDPADLVVVVTGALSVIGILRRGSTPVSGAGRAVASAGSAVAAPVIQGAQHLPWPLRQVTSVTATVSATLLTSEAALVLDGASTIVAAAGGTLRGAPLPHGSSKAGPPKEDASRPAASTGKLPASTTTKSTRPAKATTKKSTSASSRRSAGSTADRPTGRQA
jgi:hypothetical protein